MLIPLFSSISRTEVEVSIYGVFSEDSRVMRGQVIGRASFSGPDEVRADR